MPSINIASLKPPLTRGGHVTKLRLEVSGRYWEGLLGKLLLKGFQTSYDIKNEAVCLHVGQ